MSKKQFFGVIWLAILWSLSGCSGSSIFNANPSASCQQMLLQQQKMRELEHDGIQVLQQGEEVSLVLFSDQFFHPNSNNLRDDSTLYLDKVIAFMNLYSIEGATVTGYTDNTGDALRNVALSRAQAQVIVRYLMDHGLAARFVAGQGKGGCDPVANNGYLMERKKNRRMIIFFRLPEPDNVFH